MAKKDGGTVTVEVEKRLEDLFRDDAESFDFLEDSGNLEDPSPAELETSSDFLEGGDELQDDSPVELEISPDFLEDTGDFASSPPRELDESSGFEEESDSVRESPLKELKTIVLSIDWEINDEDMTELIREVAGDLLGEEKLLATDTEMGAEDFGSFSDLAPGAMFRLGCELEDDRRLAHNPNFDVNEDCLPIGAAILAEAALRFLRRGS